MRVRLPHSNGLFLSRWGTPLTDLRASVPDGKRFCPGKFVPVSKIEGNVPCLGAKSIHFVGYLPGVFGKSVHSLGELRLFRFGSKQKNVYLSRTTGSTGCFGKRYFWSVIFGIFALASGADL